MAIHRWRAVIDFYAEEATSPDTPELMADMIRRKFTKWWPLGVVEGYPDVYKDGGRSIDMWRELVRILPALSSAAGSGEE